MTQPVLMCDFQPQNVATYRFLWSWGERGACCETERQRLEQLAQNLGRHIAFEPISATEAPPVERAERVALKAEAYALAEELEEVRVRSATMYRELEAIRADNRLLVIRDKQSSSELKTMSLELLRLQTELTAKTRELTSATEEVGILHHVASLGADTTHFEELAQRAFALEAENKRLQEALAEVEAKS